ncbi:MAG: Asp23/Gls24 family envelope stress response protein, partial [Clostridia bacterium]|nr:Asp23/Gls24 family envelope stress response protein [Clostridia bacterium]
NILTNDKKGEIKVSSEVISVISGMAVNEIEGVASLVEDPESTVYSKKMLSKGVSVETKNDEMTVSLNIVVKYGYNINEVAREVQLKVKDALENMLGLRMKSVNVIVAGVDFTEANE